MQLAAVSWASKGAALLPAGVVPPVIAFSLLEEADQLDEMFIFRCSTMNYSAFSAQLCRCQQE